MKRRYEGALGRRRRIMAAGIATLTTQLLLVKKILYGEGDIP